MYIRSLISVMIVTSAFTLVFGQTPESKKGKEKGAQIFAMSFDGDGSYLGIEMQEINKENFAKFGLRDVRGVAVEKVMENSPAAAAGLQAGDVIVRINGNDVTGTRKLARLISEVAPDHQAKIEIIRNGGEQEIVATVGRRPMPKFENGNFVFPMPEPRDMPPLRNMPQDGTPRVFTLPDGEGKAFTWRVGGGRQIGVGVTPLGPQLAEYFGVESGVMISEVRENSPAAKAGLKAGDIIVEIGGKPVKGQIDIIRVVNEKKEGDVTLTIVRDHNRQTITVTPEASKDGGFVFETDDENGLTPTPKPLQLVRPLMPSTPLAAPAPMRPRLII